LKIDKDFLILRFGFNAYIIVTSFSNNVSKESIKRRSLVYESKYSSMHCLLIL